MGSQGNAWVSPTPHHHCDPWGAVAPVPQAGPLSLPRDPGVPSPSHLTSPPGHKWRELRARPRGGGGGEKRRIMPRMQDTRKEPSPSQGCGAALGGNSQPRQPLYFRFSFSAFLTSWGLPKAELPYFHLSHMEQPQGAEQCLLPPQSVPLQVSPAKPSPAMCPCADDPLPCIGIPSQQCVPPHRHGPLYPLSSSSQCLQDHHAGMDTGQRGGLEGGWHRGCQQLCLWLASQARPPLGARVQLLKIESENIWVPHQERERGGFHLRLHQPHAILASRHPHCSPATLSPSWRCPAPRSGWIPLGSLGELLQRLAQILLKRKNSRQVALPNLVIPSPAVLAAPSAAISSLRSPQCGGDREEQFCLSKHPTTSTLRRPRHTGLGSGLLLDSLALGRCCHGPTQDPGGKCTSWASSPRSTEDPTLNPQLAASLGKRDPLSWPRTAGIGCYEAFAGSVLTLVNDSPQ
ncbi:uncharacterized protein LOC128853763 isoform X2 [Cuculus canorus]|uniref:uncharacterized protein LOC128853763 isoform X2 n=1 Tax=Cuculus canorus TaxID=55661 RepID=UPI0023AA902D|nr:uncharacterized protein LOC128853763 isoform X2 [Cuculus canorus]